MLARFLPLALSRVGGLVLFQVEGLALSRLVESLRQVVGEVLWAGLESLQVAWLLAVRFVLYMQL